MTGATPRAETPCRGVCTISPADGRCIGCGRTLAEIAAWPGLDPAERRRIMALLAARFGSGDAVAAGAVPA